MAPGARARTIAIAMLVLLVGGAATAQVVLPQPPKATAERVVTIYGTGSLDFQTSDALSEFVASPAAKLTLSIQTRKDVVLFTSFNRGAGLTEIAADKFAVSSILFPNSGSSAFQGQLNISPVPLKDWLGRLGTRMGFSKVDRGEWEIGPFAEFAWQTYHPKLENEFLDFSARFYSLGLRHKYHVYVGDDARRLAFGFALSYVDARIQDDGEAHFRQLVNDATAAVKFHGSRVKLYVQVNDLIAEAEYMRIGRRGERGGDPAGVSGEQFVIRFVATGEVFGF